MNLIIKGMEMPKHAIKNGTDDTLYRSCVIVHPDGTAELIVDSTFADMFGFEHALNRFPLVEIPKPHGRLIDADKLHSSLLDVWHSEHNPSFIDALREVAGMPTIIEAEG